MAYHSFKTRTEMAEFAAVSNGDVGFCLETIAHYRYDSSSSAAPDQWCVIRPGSAKASRVLTATANFSVNETVTIGGITYTFKTAWTAGSGLAYEVMLGASLSTSLSNLAAAIILGAGPGTAYGDETWTLCLQHPIVSATSTGTTLTVTAKDAGTAANATALSETAANASWAGGTLTGGVDTVAGRYIIADTMLTQPILGDGADDWINFRDISFATAANGIIHRLGAGTYQSKTRQRMALSGAHLVATAKTIINTAIADLDNRGAPILGYPITTAVDTVASDVPLGGNQFQIAGSMTVAVGDHVVVFIDQYRGQQFRVVAWNAGTKTFTTDRVAMIPQGSSDSTDAYPAGAGIWKITPFRDAIIHFNGAQLKGACSRFVEPFMAWNCDYFGPAYLGDGTTTTAIETIFSWDSWSYNCHAWHMIGDGGGVTQLGGRFESTENCTFHHSRMRSCLYSNWIVGDAVNSNWHDCQGLDGLGDGLTVAGVNHGGSHNCVWHGGAISGNAGWAVRIEGGSARCGITAGASIIKNGNGVWDIEGRDNFISGGVTIRLNNNGIALDASSRGFKTSPDVNVTNNTTGVQVISGASKAKISGDFSNNAIAALINSQCHLSSFTATTEGNETTLAILADGDVTADHLDLVQTTAGALANVDCAGSLKIASGKVQQDAGGTGINLTGNAQLRAGSQVAILGHGETGRGIMRSNNATYDVQGAQIEKSAIISSIAADSVPEFDGIATARG